MLPQVAAYVPQTLCTAAQPGTAPQNISQLLSTCPFLDDSSTQGWGKLLVHSVASVEESTPKPPEADALDGKSFSRPLLSSGQGRGLPGAASPGPTAALKLHSPERKVSDGFQTKLLALADTWKDLP